MGLLSYVSQRLAAGADHPSLWRLSSAVLSPRLGGRGCWGWGSMVRVVLGKMAVCGVVMLLPCCVLATHVPAQRSTSARVSWRAAAAQTCSFFCDVALCYNC